MAPRVILWTYPESPFGNKILMVLALRKIKFTYVPVSVIPPRPALQGLGITYRRIPVLAIGSDVYVETSHIIRGLEEAFPDSKEHPSIYGRPGNGNAPAAQQDLVQAWADAKMFSTMGGLLPWGKGGAMGSEAFVKDRETYLGGKIDPEKMARQRPYALIQMQGLLAMVSHLVEARSEAVTPDLMDVAMAYVLVWLRAQKFAPDLFSGIEEKTSKWLDRMQSIQESSKDLIEETIKDKAIARLASLVRDQPALPTRTNDTYRDPSDLAQGDRVVVTPNDTGRIGQHVIMIPPSAGYEGSPPIQFHAPRLNYTPLYLPDATAIRGFLVWSSALLDKTVGMYVGDASDVKPMMEVKSIHVRRASKMEKVVTIALTSLQASKRCIVRLDSTHPGSINKLCSLAEITKREWLKGKRKGLHQYNVLEKDAGGQDDQAKQEAQVARAAQGDARPKVVPKMTVYLSAKKVDLAQVLDGSILKASHQRPQKRAGEHKKRPVAPSKTDEQGKKRKREDSSPSLGSSIA